MNDYEIIKRLSEKALNRWENEGGKLSDDELRTSAEVSHSGTVSAKKRSNADFAPRFNGK